MLPDCNGVARGRAMIMLLQLVALFAFTFAHSVLISMICALSWPQQYPVEEKERHPEHSEVLMAVLP